MSTTPPANTTNGLASCPASGNARGTSDAASSGPQPTPWAFLHGHCPRRWLLVQLCLAGLAAVLRLVSLSSPTDAGTPIFDEKHYVPQAWQILRGISDPLTGLAVGGIEDNPGYGLVVHPPLAKQIMALGMSVFGYSPWGWRICAALAGVAVICLIAGIARRLSGSDLVGLIAGVLALSDGILLLTSRTGMLDIFQTAFLVAAVYFLICDHQQVDRLWRRWSAEQGTAPAATFGAAIGPAVGFRWWRFAAGLCLGATLSVKWSGLYYMAFFGVTVVALDAFRRHRFGVRRPLLGALLRDSLPHFYNLVIVPAGVYLLSWRAWFASETGVYRHVVESGKNEDANALASTFSFLPDAWLNFIYYHVSVLRFHAELTNSNGHHHPWESKPWTWLASTKSLMYYNVEQDGGKHTVALLVGTPAIWFPTALVLGYGLYRLLWRRDARWVVPIVGYAAGFLPWFFNLDRQMYLFYAVNLAPFLIIGIALVCAQLMGWRRSPTEGADEPEAPLGRWGRATAWCRANPGPAIVVVYLAFAVWNFLFFLPLYTAMPITDVGWTLRMWLPTWH